MRSEKIITGLDAAQVDESRRVGRDDFRHSTSVVISLTALPFTRSQVFAYEGRYGEVACARPMVARCRVGGDRR